MNPTFFATPAEFRTWLQDHHESSSELYVGYYKKGTGQPSMTWPESVDEALCFGWIDGVRKRIDDLSYMIRFTPRKPRSIWSSVNIARVAELTALGRMQPAGLRAFGNRSEAKSSVYSYEQKGEAALAPEDEAAFRARPDAWAFFTALPAGYRKTAIWWILSAKKEETRRKRLAELIEDSAAGRKIGKLSWDSPKKKES
ncbi:MULTISPECIES: YdeI/OmpD-associated family protein [Paenibacillus]|uniref:YdeI/OmpD-associated family protein n=1 Tax=Paenibacillus TaxID=44249 RepID=UPI0022B909DD|nr:YdeI/OmpD-associated family protein [Paenibacillus caseinilyticus]MCZ8522122.1 YdeI/OmpD-associated family protein [Paenibacillus caseinilyticus]